MTIDDWVTEHEYKFEPSEIDDLHDALDDLQQANGKRIVELTALCKDLWLYAMRPQHGGVDGAELHDRMDALGLLEEE